MTAEERFTKIENFLVTIAEHQADHDERFREIESWTIRHEQGVAELRAAQTGLTLAITHVAEAHERLAETHERLAEAHARLANAHERTEEVQQATEAKLNALIDTVDRIIRKNGFDA